MRFEGDTIVCTTSVGVLQSGAMTFNPPLPGWKMQAINQVRMANYVKVFAQFSSKWWGHNEYIFMADEQKGKYPMWMPINGNTLMCAVAGEEADRVEKLSADELKSEIHEFLNKHAAAIVSEVVDVHVSIWRNDPHFCGAYSFLPVHCFNEDPVMFHWLTEPVATVGANRRFRPTLHFAGEAFDFNYGGQLQGAFNSGRDVAIRVIAELN